VTLPQILGVNHWVVIIALALMAGGMFAALETLEKSGKRSAPGAGITGRGARKQAEEEKADQQDLNG
jgi:hypothetical protein